MDQTDITKPSVQNGPGYSFAYSSYIHTTAWVLRKLVALMTGDGTLFDETFTVETPGLGEGKVSCSVCIPKNTDSMKDVAMPLLIVLEGGGFVLGQPSDGERFDRMLSDRLNCVVLSIEYAKSPRYPFPHALLQIYEVLRWAISEDGARCIETPIDASRIAFLGNSAGGNLVASLSLLTSFTSGPCSVFREALGRNFRSVAQVMLYPSVDCNHLYRTRFESASKPVQSKSLPIWAAEMMEASYLPPYVSKDQIFVAPLSTSEELLQSLQPQLPPASFFLAGLDCLKGEAVQYAAKLERAGVKVLVKEFANAVHGFSHYRENNKDYLKEAVEDCWESVYQELQAAFTQDNLAHN